MFVLAVAVGMTTTWMAIAVVATIITATAMGATIIVLITFVAHVVAECAAGATASCRADQAACGAAHAAADHVTAGCAQRTTDGRFATAAFVCADCTTTRAAKGRANG